MGDWVEPTEVITQWHIFQIHNDSGAAATKHLERSLCGKFTLLNRYIYVEDAQDAAFLRMRGYVEGRGGQTYRVSYYASDSGEIPEPLIGSDLARHQRSQRLRRWTNAARKCATTVAGTMAVRVSSKAGRENPDLISIQIGNPRQMLLPSYKLRFSDLSDQWSRYMITAGFTTETNDMFADIHKRLNLEWNNRNRPQILFGVDGIHTRLTVEADEADWVSRIDPIIEGFNRTLSWNRRHVHVYDVDDEIRLRTMLGNRIIQRESNYLGSVFRK